MKTIVAIAALVASSSAFAAPRATPTTAKKPVLVTFGEKNGHFWAGTKAATSAHEMTGGKLVTFGRGADGKFWAGTQAASTSGATLK